MKLSEGDRELIRSALLDYYPKLAGEPDLAARAVEIAAIFDTPARIPDDELLGEVFFALGHAAGLRKQIESRERLSVQSAEKLADSATTILEQVRLR